MKKITYLLFTLLVAMCNSCSNSEDDIFSDSASIRMQKALMEYSDLLVSAQHGWYADYYPESNYKIGGYAMYLKFNSSGFVDVACEIETNVPARDMQTSQYEFIADQGPVLSFSTYNPVMHYFSEPNSSDYDGLYGDYEFVVMEAGQDTIELKGRKHGNRLILRRNVDEADPDIHLSAVADIREDVSEFGMFSFVMKGERIGMVAVIDRTFSIGYKMGGEDKTTSVSYAFTPEGLRLYEPFEFKGVIMQNFNWLASEQKYVCSDPGVDAFFDIYFPDDYELRYAEMIGTWNMHFYASGSGTALWMDVDIEISQKKRNVSYTVSAPGAVSFPLELNFDAQKGKVGFLVHNIGTEPLNGYTVRALMYSQSTGQVTTSATAGLEGVWNHDAEGERIINFVDNGRWVTYPANGIILRMYDGTAYIANFTNNVIGHYRLTDITITKISD